MSDHKNIWYDGVMGVVVGDALGLPVQFLARDELDRNPVKRMEGFGAYNMPAGTWSDDGSMTLATLDSLTEKGCVDLADIMNRFVAWYLLGKYTQHGKAFDVGGTTRDAVFRYSRSHDRLTCGPASERNNGNGSLMRILPVCLCAVVNPVSIFDPIDELFLPQPIDKYGPYIDYRALLAVHRVAGLTHGHIRSKIACGLYYFIVKHVMDSLVNGKPGTALNDCIWEGLQEGFSMYLQIIQNGGAYLDQPEFKGLTEQELANYTRLNTPDAFSRTPRREIRSSGYVVDSLEAAVWCLLTTNSYADCVLKAVNLGDDTDTIAAIAGGIAGLYYGSAGIQNRGIPKRWIDTVTGRRPTIISDICSRADRNLGWTWKCFYRQKEEIIAKAGDLPW